MELPSDLLHTPMNHKYSKVNMSLQEKLVEIMEKVDYLFDIIENRQSPHKRKRDGSKDNNYKSVS